MNEAINKFIIKYKLSYLIPIIIIFLIFVRSLDLGLDKAEPSTRMQFHAIPVALSVLYFDWSWDYTADSRIAWLFQGRSGKPIDETIAKVMDPDYKEGGATYYWTVDDRGLALYTIGAFLLFGPSLKSLFYFYFVILFASSVLFWAGLRENREARCFLSLYLLTILCSLPIWILGTMDANFGEGTIHLSESRLFGILAIIPTAYIYFAYESGLPRSRQDKILLLTQVAALMFFLHVRSSILWMIIALVALFVVKAGWQAVRRKGAGRPIRFALLIAASMIALTGYKYVMLNSVYLDKAGVTRTFWHNAIMGLAESEFFRSHYQIYGDDRSAIRLVIERRVSPHLADKPALLNEKVQEVLNSLGSFAQYDWPHHEREARRLYLSTMVEYPAEFIKTYTVHKIISAAKIFDFVFGFDHLTGIFDDSSKKFPPVISVTLVLAAILLFMVGMTRGIGGRIPLAGNFCRTYVFLLWLLPFSTLPFMLIYTSVVTQASSTALLIMLCLVGTMHAGMLIRSVSTAPSSSTA